MAVGFLGISQKFLGHLPRTYQDYRSRSVPDSALHQQVWGVMPTPYLLWGQVAVDHSWVTIEMEIFGVIASS